MQFNETLAYIVIFAVIYNLLSLLELRLRAGEKEPLSKNTILIIVPVMIISTTVFVGASCYIAYQGFMTVYPKSTALFATLFFTIAGTVLIWKLISALRLVPGRGIEDAPERNEPIAH